MGNLSENSWSPGRDFTREHPKYESEALPLEPICSVIHLML
jgi:hypothetical protein